MRAILLDQYGDADRLRYDETNTPQPAPGEVLVRVKATSINPVDWKMRSGEAKSRFPLDFPAILGRDLAGEVEDGGGTSLQAGYRVMALTWKTYAEFCVAKAEDLAVIPQGMSFEQAAALPLVTLTGTQLIERAIQLQAGQTVLVTGAVGSVGRSAVHAARKLGAHVIAGVRKSEKDKVKALGADQIVALDDDRELADLHGLDAIADTVGGETIGKLLKTLRSGGVVGSVLGPPKDADKYDISVKAMMAVPDGKRLGQLAEDVARGEFAIPIARTMPLRLAAEAHKLAERGGVGGKIILVP